MHSNILFSAREMYEMQHDPSGRSYRMKGIKETERRKLEQNNMHLMEGMRFDKRTSFPVLEAYQGEVDYTYVSYPKRKSAKPKETLLHFFAQDYQFRAIWDKLDSVTMDLKDFAVRTTPDYSMWTNVPEYYNIDSVFKSRFCGAYWQQHGYSTIPTASWGDKSSFRYCLAGLPRHSVLAVCGTGIMDKESFELWSYGLHAVEDELAPIKLLVYGEPKDVPGLQTELIFIPTEINKFRSYENK